MIRAGTLPQPTITPAPDSPRADLAAALNGIPLGRDSIAVGTTLVTVSPVGVVRVGRRAVGMWFDGTDVLAARVRAVAGGAVGHG